METKPIRTAFLGADFDALDLDEAVDAIAAKASAQQPFVYVATPNVDHLVRLNRDAAGLSPLYREAWLVLCDSRIIQPLARLSGLNLPVAPGADIAALLFERAIGRDEPISIVGGTAETAALLAARYQLSKIAHHIPPMGLRHNPAALAAIADFIVDHPARFVFLCVGSPQQEMIARVVIERGGATGVGLCVGAALEFLTGEKARAPLWIRRAKLEWLHRLLSEPARLWKRYLVDGPEIFGIWMAWNRKRRLI